MKPIITKLRAVAERITKMIETPGQCQAVKRAAHQTLQQLLQKVQQGAAKKQTLLQCTRASASSSGPRQAAFLTDISEQLSCSRARSNQLEAFTAVSAYSADCCSDRPPQQQLQQVTSATLDAFCKLRLGICDMIVNLRLSSTNSSSNARHPEIDSEQLSQLQQKIDQLLEGFAAAWSAEQELFSKWENLAAGVVEPTGRSLG